jgi:hypothetical protein
LFGRLLDDGGKIAPSAVLHDDVEDAGVAVDMAVMISNNMFMLEVF